MNAVLAERAPRAQATPDIKDKYEAECRREAWIAAQWRLAPHMIAHESSDQYVFLDAEMRAIARVFADGRTEMLDPDAEYTCDDWLERIYHGTYPPHKIDQAWFRGCIELFKLGPELKRRRELLRRGELAG